MPAHEDEHQLPMRFLAEDKFEQDFNVYRYYQGISKSKTDLAGEVVYRSANRIRAKFTRVLSKKLDKVKIPYLPAMQIQLCICLSQGWGAAYTVNLRLYLRKIAQLGMGSFVQVSQSGHIHLLTGQRDLHERHFKIPLQQSMMKICVCGKCELEQADDDSNSNSSSSNNNNNSRHISSSTHLSFSRLYL